MPQLKRSVKQIFYVYPIAGREDAKPLDIPINMFNIDSALWNNRIINSLKGGQLSSSLRFYRDHAVGMEFLDTLISFIRKSPEFAGRYGPCSLETSWSHVGCLCPRKYKEHPESKRRQQSGLSVYASSSCLNSSLSVFFWTLDFTLRHIDKHCFCLFCPYKASFGGIVVPN